jgi:predicted dehydrogenase
MAAHLSWVISQTPGSRLVAGRYRALLTDPAVEVVYVSLPHHLHLPWVLECLAAGKAVLCEKPLGLTAAEVSAMRAAGGLLVEAAMWRWSALLDAVPSVGPVEHVEAGFTIAGASGWRLDPDAGGGALYDLGCYPVGAALRWAGPVEHVAAAGGFDEATLVLDHVSGATSSLRVGFRGPPRQWLVVTGSAGEVSVVGDVFTGSGGLEVSDGASTVRTAVAAEPYAAMVASVAAAVRSRRASAGSGDASSVPGAFDEAMPGDAVPRGAGSDGVLPDGVLPDGALAVATVLDRARTLLPWPSRPS